MYVYWCDWPPIKFCPLQTLVETALPELLKTCTSMLAFERLAVPVSVTVAVIETPDPATTVDGVAVAEELQVSTGAFGVAAISLELALDPAELLAETT